MITMVKNCTLSIGIYFFYKCIEIYNDSSQLNNPNKGKLSISFTLFGAESQYYCPVYSPIQSYIRRKALEMCQMILFT